MAPSLLSSALCFLSMPAVPGAQGDAVLPWDTLAEAGGWPWMCGSPLALLEEKGR